MAKGLGWYRPERLVLKITLDGSQPEIWRRVEVHSSMTLHELHHVVQCVFMWDDSHLYHFLVAPGGKLMPSTLREAVRYHVLPPDPYGHSPSMKEGHADEQIIGRVLTNDCRQILYVYDFGDSWEHLIELEDRLPDDDETHMPKCLAGASAAPKDDTGGIPGYYMLLESLRDQANPRHKEAATWLGKNFDPGRFDLDLANTRLSSVFRPPPKKPRRKRT